jgi:RNA polymerase sigma-70 factor (ECF subfamily)
MKNAADAEDLTSEVFIKLLKHSPAFKSKEHEKAWLIRTAINQCKDNLKHWWRKREDLTDYSETLKSETVFGADDVINAVLTLPKKYKAVVCLYYFEGYRSSEISKLLGKPHSTIRNYLREARAILKERLGEFYE